MDLTVKDPTKPGYNPHEAIQQPIPKITRATIDFMLECGVPKGARIVDIGPESYKSNEMRKYWDVKQADAEDLNFGYPEFEPGWGSIPDNSVQFITCFEIIEHLQNPYELLDYLKWALTKDGTLFLSTPGRPRMFWPEFHYHEIPPDHLQKWLLTPLGLKIIRKKKIWMDHPWWFYFTGIRPFLRLWFGHSWIYEIKKEETKN